MGSRKKDLEEQMWVAAEMLALAVETAVQTDVLFNDKERKARVNAVLKSAKTFTERYRAYLEDLTKLT